jgi:GT2 family glycosyltransferase
MPAELARPRQPPAPLSVVISTIGRVSLLTRCLESIAACDPLPSEVVVVDQSGGKAVSELVGRFGGMGARVVTSNERNVALGRNDGLRSARHDLVLITDDDCRVAPSWVAAGWAHLVAMPEAIVTGRVLPGGRQRPVPSTKEDPEPCDYTGETHCYVLYTNNMGLSRSAALDFGGFDERFDFGAEDNDFCYRWLRAGRTLRYEPDLVVWHDDWRTPAELERVYIAYARAMGPFYAKHLRQGDLLLLRQLAGELLAGLRSLVSGPLKGRPRWKDPQRAVLPWLPIGLVEGLRRFPSGPSQRARK